MASSRITRRSSTQSQQEQEEDDDIIEIMDVAPPEKIEEERKYARQKESILNDEMKFMENFDPDNSRRRLKRSRRRHYHPDGRPMVVADDFDICDCLEPKCRGCHRPCKNCKDKRCGLECRVNRRWIYETVDIEGRNKTLRHPHMYGEPY